MDERAAESIREIMMNNSEVVVRNRNAGRRFSLVEHCTSKNSDQIPISDAEDSTFCLNETIPEPTTLRKEFLDEIEAKVRYLYRISNSRVNTVAFSPQSPDHILNFAMDFLNIKIAAVIQSFTEIMKSRFELVNSYCDTTYEPVVFNSIKKKWTYNVEEDFDALDYVVCYITHGRSTNNVPEVDDHWHYVGFGLSDIYGNGFYYQIQQNPSTGKSGFGFELSFRLKYDPEEMVNGQPPDWPAVLLQKVAAYVCATGGSLAPGDHITWNSPLDKRQSAITQMVITSDPTIPTLKTKTGLVDVFQIVGITSEEVEVIQNWNALSVLDLFKTYALMGGQALVTDIKRQASIFTLYPEVKKLVLDGIRKDGSNLSGVNSKILWTERCLVRKGGLSQLNHLTWKERHDEVGYPSGFGGALNLSDERFIENDVHCPLSDLSECLSQFSLNGQSENPTDPDSDSDINIVYYDTIHLTMDPEAASILPLAMSGRVDHDRHFTFKSWKSNMAVTFVPELLPGSFATNDRPYAAKGDWLHVLLSKYNRDQIVHEVTSFFQQPNLTYPKLVWIESEKFAISIEAYILS